MIHANATRKHLMAAMASKPAMPFPKMASHAKGHVQGDRIRFSYMDSKSKPVTETKPLLGAKEILKLVGERMERFSQPGQALRESDFSRRQRKYIAAQPEPVLRQAWELADPHQRMELGMMLSENSHHGLSDPAWLEAHAGDSYAVYGDDGRPLC